MRPLAPDDVLIRDPRTRFVWQSDGRLLVHHPRGTSLLDGCDPGELDALLAKIDGRRTASEITTVLEPEIPAHRSRRLLRLLLGELLVRHEETPPRIRVTETRSGERTPLRSVGIVGGGSAGHLAALALQRAFPTLDLTLIESPRVPVIGVGEATTPLMPQFLHADLGVELDTFWSQVRPTLKLGIRFVWGPEPGETFPYPFGPIPLADALTHDGHLRGAGPRALMMAAGKIPLPRDTDPDADPDIELSGLGTDVAYHLDNPSFVGWLRPLAEVRGIERVEADIVAVERDGSGSVAALRTREGQSLRFDFYLDCSGFPSLLMGEALGSPWVGWETSLFNDRALVASRPRPAHTEPAPFTEARAFSSGWCWNTPVRGTDHRGYVYSSAFLDEGAAEAEMRRRIPGLGEIRALRFRSGRRQHFWRGNVAALGNAYGFVEPLESTALHLLIRQIGWLIEGLGGDSAVDAPHLPGEGQRDRLDQRCARAWDYLAWFLALHFRFNRALDTPYWRACRASADIERHRELVMAYERRGPLSTDPLLSEGFAYPDPLWGPDGIDVILSGQGLGAGPFEATIGPKSWRQRSRAWRRAVEASPSHHVWLGKLDDTPALRRGHTAPFLRHGPAFLAGAGRPQPSTLRKRRA